METPAEKPLIERIDLKNGLKLELYDFSRPLAGDRWYVELKARIEIPVEERWFGSKHTLPADIVTLRKELGQQVVFEYHNKRNFISETEKESVFRQMCSNLKNNARNYYNHPDFAALYLLKQYQLSQNRPRR